MKALPQIDGNNPKWRGAHLIVIPFDPRMKNERDTLASQLVGQGYYLFIGRKEDVERFILKEGAEKDDDKRDGEIAALGEAMNDPSLSAAERREARTRLNKLRSES